MEFPVTRLRRLRRTETMRSLVRETHLRPDAFIYPLFICPGEGVRREVSSMPGVFNLSMDEAMKEV
jgi:porphobilinogen synthase